jgi:hypothetical protein
LENIILTDSISLDKELKFLLDKKFNPTTWIGDHAFNTYKHAGINLVEEVNALNPDLVIDAGCGKNRFKGHIQNLIGFDMQQFPFVDIPLGFDEIEFRKESADVVLALGSIQFGNREIVERHLAKVVSWVKPGGYIVMRTQSDMRFKIPNFQETHYIWTEEDVDLFSKQFNLKVTKGINYDEWRDRKGSYIGERWVWWWQKPGKRVKQTINPSTCKLTRTEINE